MVKNSDTGPQYYCFDCEKQHGLDVPNCPRLNPHLNKNEKVIMPGNFGPVECVQAVGSALNVIFTIVCLGAFFIHPAISPVGLIAWYILSPRRS